MKENGLGNTTNIKAPKFYRFVVRCAFCNEVLFKTNIELFACLYETAIKCPKCQKILTSSAQVNVGGSPPLTKNF